MEEPSWILGSDLEKNLLIIAVKVRRTKQDASLARGVQRLILFGPQYHASNFQAKFTESEKFI